MTWRKSSYSSSSGGACIEVASSATTIAVRDTKQADMGDKRTVLGFSSAAWIEFTRSIRLVRKYRPRSPLRCGGRGSACLGPGRLHADRAC